MCECGDGLQEVRGRVGVRVLMAPIVFGCVSEGCYVCVCE